MDKTFEYRRQLKFDILQQFPRFLDVPSLASFIWLLIVDSYIYFFFQVEHDFRKLYPDFEFKKLFVEDEKKINIYELTVKNPLPHIVGNTNNPTDIRKCIYFLMNFHILPTNVLQHGIEQFVLPLQSSICCPTLLIGKKTDLEVVVWRNC